MTENDAPYHAHVYYIAETRDRAEVLHRRLNDEMRSGAIPQLLFVGSLKDQKAGPHPIPQFEIHYTERALPAVTELIMASGLTALLHPLTDNDLADHTYLAQWLGTPLELDLTTLDPPGMNKGVARFGMSDF